MRERRREALIRDRDKEREKRDRRAQTDGQTDQKTRGGEREAKKINDEM